MVNVMTIITAERAKEKGAAAPFYSYDQIKPFQLLG